MKKAGVYDFLSNHIAREPGRLVPWNSSYGHPPAHTPRKSNICYTSRAFNLGNRGVAEGDHRLLKSLRV